jgi:hypothetical protein
LVKGVYTASGTTAARTTVLASRSAGTLGTSRIVLSGTAQVRIVAAAEDMDGVRGTRSVTGTSDTLAATDLGYVVTYSNAAAVAVSLAQAGTASLYDGWATLVQNLGAGTVTITPATSTINGAATLVLATNMGAFIWSDGTNYHYYYVQNKQTTTIAGGTNLNTVIAPGNYACNDNTATNGPTVGGQWYINVEIFSSIGSGFLMQRATSLLGDGGVWTRVMLSGTFSSWIPSLTAAVQSLSPAQRGQVTLNLQHAFKPQGRLYVVSNTPVQTSSITGNGTVFYGPYDGGNVIPLYDGTTFNPTIFAEVSQVVTDTTKSPAAAAASNNYDMFAWLDGSTFRVTRGPAWTNATTRATALTNVNGIWLNAGAITNGPAASRGTYVGTIRTRAADGLIDYSLGGAALGGTPGFIGVWNAYNRVPVACVVEDTLVNNTSTAGVLEALNHSNNNRVNYVIGLAEDVVEARVNASVAAGTGGSGGVAIGHDSISAITGFSSITQAAGVVVCTADASINGDIGFHFFQALQFAVTNTATFYGNGTTGFNIHTGLTVKLRA